MKPPLQRYRFLLSTYLSPLARQTALLGLLLLAGVGLRLASPLFLAAFVDLAASGGELDALLRQGSWFLGASILVQGIAVLESWLAADLALLTTNRLRADLTLHCLRLDMSFHKAHTPGEMIERVDGDVGALGNLLSRFIVDILGSIILMAAVLVLMYTIDWRVGLTFSGFCAVTLALMALLKDVAVPRFRAARQSEAELMGFLEERLAGTEDVRANGAVEHVMRRFCERSRPVWRSWMGANAIGTLSFCSTWILFAVGSALSLALGAHLYQRGIVTIGTVYLVFRYAELLNQPIESLVRQLTDLQQAGASATRILDLLGMRSSIPDAGGAAIPAGQPLSLSAEGISFAYRDGGSEGDPALDVLSGVEFHLPPGAALGLLGRTGSGKTSLTRLLVRLYEPQQGSLRLGNVPLPEVPIAVLRRRVALVTQEVQLLDASLRDNLTLFDPSIADERILAAFRELGLMDWYATLPQGLETGLEAGGSRLSAGEAQLLAFVRVFLRDPGLVILDEASSRLDPATESRLERAIQGLLRGRTAIIIAHRLNTVHRADRILILEHGRQAEYGDRLELAGDPHSRFAGLLRKGMEEVLA